MGTSVKDTLGNVKGKIGNLAGSFWMGDGNIRSPQVSGKKGPYCDKQQHTKFALMVNFLQLLAAPSTSFTGYSRLNFAKLNA